MNNNIRVLTNSELQLISGGSVGFGDIPDPVVPNFNPPLPSDGSKPLPDPSWGGFIDPSAWFIDPSAWAKGVPTPEPATPIKGFP